MGISGIKRKVVEGPQIYKQTLKRQKTILTHIGPDSTYQPVLTLHYSKEGDHLITSGSEGVIRIFDASYLIAKSTIYAFQSEIHDLEMSNCG